MIKTCAKCHIAKPLPKFQRDRTKKDGCYPICKTCRSEIWHQKHPRKPVDITPENRFWSYVKMGDITECWPWQMGYFSNGYGQTHWEGKGVKAHRLAFFLSNGYWGNPCTMHMCDNRLCCNPSHLKSGTNKDNTQDAVRKNRMAHGERGGLAKLTNEQAITIRKLYASGEYTQKQLGTMFGITRESIQNILYRKTFAKI